MKELTSLDQRILNYKIENVFPVIADFSNYPKWFPENLNINVIKSSPEKVGSAINIKIGVIQFNIELKRINQNKEIIVQYSGAYEGQGIWYFFDSTNGTKLMYEIELKIKNPLVRLISLFINIASFHSKMMTKIFDGLEDYLNNIYRTNTDGFDNSNNSKPKIFSITGN